MTNDPPRRAGSTRRTKVAAATRMANDEDRRLGMRRVGTMIVLALLATIPSDNGAAIAQGDYKPLALHPENPHYFLFRGKPTVIVTSAEHYGAVLNLDFDYVKYLDELAAHGL